MKKLTEPTVLRIVLLPLLGACGAVFALLWPVGHKAFCSGLSGLVV